MTVTFRPDGLYIASQDRPIAPPFPELTPAQELALLARILSREGYNDHLAGHITYRQPDGTFLVNPYGLVWGELQASDIMSMDEEGNLLGGKWTITPAIAVHLELHRTRQVTIALHNHPEYGTLWADIGRAPEVYDQTGAFTNAKVAVYSEYEGAVDQVSNARAVVDAMGDAEIALLAHHGVLIVGESVRQLYLPRHPSSGGANRPIASPRPAVACRWIQRWHGVTPNCSAATSSPACSRPWPGRNYAGTRGSCCDRGARVTLRSSRWFRRKEQY